MNGSTEIEAGPSRSYNHTPSSSSTPNRRYSHSQTTGNTQHSRSQSQSSSHSQRRQSSSQVPDKSSSSSSFSHQAGEQPPSTNTPRKPTVPQLDIATYPTQQLLKLLAGLLQHIATSNDALRLDPDLDSEDQEVIGDNESEYTRGEEEEGYPSRKGESSNSRSRTHSRTSSQTQRQQYQNSSSPTTALFDSDQSQQSQSQSYSTDTSEDDTSITNGGGDPRNNHYEGISKINNQDEFPLFTASKSSLSHPSSLLAFHARHIPSISIESYLLRILKYCPTTNEVFLGLLVYFDRMTRLGTPQGVGGTNAIFNGSSNPDSNKNNKKSFAIDSYNVHRLVIAGVTVASKFFSDVFYTNSRYAKVGGLPPTELNSLELQFLLLNDFRLRISLEEMQKYGDRLLAYALEEEEKHRLETERERERMEKSNIEDTSTQVSENGQFRPEESIREDQNGKQSDRDKKDAANANTAQQQKTDSSTSYTSTSTEAQQQSTQPTPAPSTSAGIPIPV
ncbi:uncharacterized protein L201_002569 [Kwoniella dendrophila CBS 6074]|uniref:Cyclin n=1 Tax=Kwoniella dendrophila CBS 6074 TaxID=1295534 RepID=A0AAX4JS02_9TREE